MLAHGWFSDIIRSMTNEKQTPAVRSPESDALRSLYFLSHANPEAGIEDLRGINLAEFAVIAMEEAGLDIAGEYRKRLLERKIEGMHALVAEETYASLTEAVHLAATELRLEDLSFAWFSREEYENSREFVTDIDEPVAFEDVEEYLLDEMRICERYTDPDEFRIAYRLAHRGFEGVDKAITEFYVYRLSLIKQATQDKSASTTYRVLGANLTRLEHDRFIKRNVPEHQMLFYAYDWLLSAIKELKTLSVETLRELDTHTVRFCEEVIEDTLANKQYSSRNNVLSSKLLEQLLERDPENETYLKWKKKLTRHFKVHQFGLIAPIYGSSEVQYALHNLGEFTVDDSVAALASRAIDNTTV